MKKIAFVLLFILFVFSSCSSDDSGNSEIELTTEGYLIKKGVYTTNAGVTTVYEYYYDGNKIIKVESSDGLRQEFMYTGDLITEINFFTSNILNTTEKYQYNSQGKMIQRKVFLIQTNECRRSEYNYNQDGTVSILIYLGDFNTQNNLISERKVFFLANSDVQKIENYVTVNGVNHTRTTSYTYDSMNSTSNSILGVNKIKKWDDGSNPGNIHNITSEISTTTESTGTVETTFSYTYNSYGFPMTSTFVYGTSQIGSSQYFYQ